MSTSHEPSCPEFGGNCPDGECMFNVGGRCVNTYTLAERIDLEDNE